MSGNTLLTSQSIAREATIRLQSTLVNAGLVYTDYSDTFANVGDSVRVRKPATFIADDFGGTINLQDINETSVTVKLNQIADVSVELESKQLTLDIQNFGDQVIDGAMLAIQEKIDKGISAMYQYVPYYSGVSGATPETLANIATAMKTLNKNRVPPALRRAIWSPEAHASLIVLDAIAGLDKSGTTAALREASMGRIHMFDNYMNQNIKTHEAGAYSALEDVKATIVATNNAQDATTGLTYSVAALTSTAGTAETKLLKGDLLVINGKSYTVIEDTAAAVSGVIAITKIYPAVSANVTAQDVTFPDKTAGGHVANLGFHKNAFALVSRPLALPMGGADGYVTNLANQINVRVTMGYNMTTKKNIISFDCLYGISPIFPELAVRILG